MTMATWVNDVGDGTVEDQELATAILLVYVREAKIFGDRIDR